MPPPAVGGPQPARGGGGRCWIAQRTPRVGPRALGPRPGTAAERQGVMRTAVAAARPACPLIAEVLLTLVLRHGGGVLPVPGRLLPRTERAALAAAPAAACVGGAGGGWEAGQLKGGMQAAPRAHKRRLALLWLGRSRLVIWQPFPCSDRPSSATYLVQAIQPTFERRSTRHCATSPLLGCPIATCSCCTVGDCPQCAAWDS